ncbi:hypothetical protein VP1G_07535 [Cytospora mali]|uniref:LysM domain-containing protein n=1 Tax=Cytospora mali TaxID=578113 RepID=A0A194V8J7_CYTMA|nr:hypothetical protein VP1G_07535 [Valsa mali var. pyri (nom. inval.)]
MSSSARLSAPAHDAEARPRNRRLGTGGDAASRSTSLLRASPSPSPSRGASPIPASRIGPPSRSSSRAAPARANTADSFTLGKSWLDGQWRPSWTSVQEFATSLISGGDTYGDTNDRHGRDTSQRKSIHRASVGTLRNNQPSAWGPEPPGSARPRIEDVAAGSLAEREAAYRARKTASVLESHDGVNGGLDVTGKFKRRNSDEETRSNAPNPDVGDQLVYVHHVQPNDTYAGIILRYRCQEDAFRKANGLWSRDNIQVRKWLALPVDACEVKGRPCEGPSYYGKEVDLLGTTPSAAPETPIGRGTAQPIHDDFFASHNGIATEESRVCEEKPWTHVRWVALDNCRDPVEIARVSRNAMGYFPPRRKKSLHTVSTLSTPRVSLDVPSISLSSDIADSPGSLSSRRQSLLANRPHTTSVYASSAPTPSRSRVGSGNDDVRPAWMRRPGGVGTLSRNVRAPGPEKDYFNSWTKKHLPGLNIDSLPSMAVMGSETAKFGFTNDEAAAIVESPFEEGRDMSSTNKQGTGLDKAAMTIETWLRGAWAKKPNTPTIGPHRARGFAEGEPDLIELEDTNSEDGRIGGGLLDQGNSGPLNSIYGSSSRNDGDASLLRGRLPPRGTSAMPKDKKAD